MQDWVATVIQLMDLMEQEANNGASLGSAPLQPVPRSSHSVSTSTSHTTLSRKQPGARRAGARHVASGDGGDYKAKAKTARAARRGGEQDDDHDGLFPREQYTSLGDAIMGTQVMTSILSMAATGATVVFAVGLVFALMILYVHLHR